MLWEIWVYFDAGWVTSNWVRPQFHFTYYGFGWVRPWSAEGMYIHFLAVGVLAACILIGCDTASAPRCSALGLLTSF